MEIEGIFNGQLSFLIESGIRKNSMTLFHDTKEEQTTQWPKDTKGR
jgi:hypothetical protein